MQVRKLVRRLMAMPYEMLNLSVKLDLVMRKLEANSFLVEKLLRHRHPGAFSVTDYEYRVFSQFGEDGIISYLVDLLQPENQSFIEFGVEDYTEANTRLLLETRNWRGLVIDGNDRLVDKIKNDAICWKYSLTVLNEFITRENINQIFSSHGFVGEIGLLSIDIDGVDYWIWKAIDAVRPVIVVAEYNSLFGPVAKVSVPYDPAFVRSKAHYSMLYYGASLNALVALGKEKGYSFVGANSAGNNAFFVRDDKMKEPLRSLSSEEGYKSRSFRESRNESGQLRFASPAEEAEMLRELPLVTFE